DRLHLTVVAGGGQHEGVGDGQLLTDVERHDVLGQLVGRRAGSDVDEGDSVVRGAHAVLSVVLARGISVSRGERWCFAMYWTTPSGTRYHTGSPRMLRRRTSVELIANAGTSTIVTRSWGIFPSVSGSIVKPGRVQPTNCARSKSSSASRQVKISARASAPVMK